MRTIRLADLVPPLAWVGVLSAIYGVCAGGLAAELGDGRTDWPGGAVVSPAATAGMDVPDTVVQTVARSVAPVSGLDELVVLPNASGGYTVSAQVELGVDASAKAAAESQMANLAQLYFQRVYGAGEDIVDAQVYFIAGGQLVGGADLGRDAYRKLDVSATTAPGAFLQAVQSLPVRTGEGADDSWAQFVTTPPEAEGDAQGS
ncbi:MAG: hypothetical protein K6T81_01060 [Alicyclobacillus macrosporangiidus]|uniref:hypothetical protein n=1 Tax=Alicyclobacillus macrosporangiidus TaxID=392015 RepID=UPI0026ECD9A5|nr:hypothetical protein [Alicyclobacillus macrosporangiidus]MCL6597309.1 hypothetical protein [Alicyclobacillus macrosporangiidus]